MTADINKVELLELVELYAEEYERYNGYVRSEDELNERFRKHILPDIIRKYGPDDALTHRLAFKDFAGRLVSEGFLHQVQADAYQYQAEG